jgi:3-phosphoshikimate 1-carboxyvinyltransferase
MSEQVSLSLQSNLIETTINLPSSKSESNRALILNHLSNGLFQVYNVSSADDTQLLIKLLASIGKESTLDCGPAGTTFRFLTTVLTFTPGTHVLTGSERMKERPIKDLISALNLIGAKITYVENDGYPPIKIEGITPQLNNTKISVANSSQYLSSLLLVAPSLPNGLIIETTGEMGSEPYVDMTIQLLKNAGINVIKQDKVFKVAPQDYAATKFNVESDWSGASYWFSRVALSEKGRLLLTGLKAKSLQGDQVVKDIYKHLGVTSEFTEEGLLITKTHEADKNLTWDFTHCPDLAQTVFASCAVLGVTLKCCGLKSLRIKETDRILAMQTELSKIGAQLTTEDDIWFTLKPSKQFPKTVNISTYHDHRMAMAFAPLAAVINSIIIENKDVVSKSYPSFWDDLALTGITVN